MTVMQFDSHSGWYNPNPDCVSRPYRADAPLRPSSYASRPASVPIEKEGMFALLERARKGDRAAEAELRARNGKMDR